MIELNMESFDKEVCVAFLVSDKRSVDVHLAIRMEHCCWPQTAITTSTCPWLRLCSLRSGDSNVLDREADEDARKAWRFIRINEMLAPLHYLLQVSP